MIIDVVMFCLNMLVLSLRIALFIVPFFLFLGAVALVIGFISKMKKYGVPEIIFSLLITLTSVYLYSFAGAYFISLVKANSEIINKWFLYFVFGNTIIIFMKESDKQAKESNIQAHNSFLNKKYEDAFLSSLVVVSLSLGWIMLLSFIFFAFFPQLRNILFFDMPDLLAFLFK